METIRIKLQGVLGEQWYDWFENMTFSYEESNTILTGKYEDQTSFHGILNRIRDLNLKLISVSLHEGSENV
jgi:hypothetical protein